MTVTGAPSPIATAPHRLKSADAVIDLGRRIGREVAGPNAAQVDRDCAWPVASIRALQTAGAGGLVVPVERGGLGHGLETLARVCETLGEHCASSALCYGMHCVGSAVIAAKATDAQRSGVLDGICAGTHLTTLALSEPGTGAHFYLPRTRIRDASGGYRVTGTKSFVTNGAQADSFVVSAVADAEDAPAGEFSCVLVDGGADGVEWGSPWTGMGMRGNTSLNMTLRDVAVPREALLGDEGDQIWYVFNVVAPYFLAAMSGTYLGVASAALGVARAHVTERVHAHDGRALAQVEIVQHRLGELWANVERTRRLVYHAGRAFDSGADEALLAVISSKAEVAECAVDTVNEALTLTGGLGYRDQGTLHRLLRDARAAHVMSPTTDLLRVWAGRVLLGLPVLGG